MAKQLNPQQAKFCSKYAETGNAYQSAIDSGYSESTANNATAVLVKNAGISERLKQSEEQIIIATGWNKSRVISELERVFTLAVNDDQLGHATKALDTIARLINAMPNNSQSKEVNHNIRFETLLNKLPAKSNSYEAKLIN
jgi:phage terminase small subunit